MTNMSIPLKLDDVLLAIQARDLSLAATNLQKLPLKTWAVNASIILIALLIVYQVVWSISSWWRLRHFHGPAFAGFSYLYLVSVCLRRDAWKVHMRTNQKYGKYARIGPNELLTSDPELLKKMGATKGPAFSRSKWYNFARVDPVEDTVLNVTSTAIHDQYRSQLLVSYSGRENRAVEDDIDWAIDGLVKMLRERYDSAKALRPVELTKMSQNFTVDSMTKICFGKPFGYLASEQDLQGILAIPDRTGRWSRITANWWLVQYCLGFALFRATFARRLVSGLTEYNRIAKEIVGGRFREIEATGDGSKYGDMMQSFINRGHTERMCELQVPVLLTAGTETTATAIRSIIFHVIASPDAYQKLQREIDEAVASGAIESTGRPVRFQEAKSLPYVAATIYEGLRMHPPFTGELMKYVPPEGYTLPDGRFVPGGTRIGHNTWEAMRDTDVFGDDAYVFRPDRFLEADPKKRSEMRSTVDLVFGAGRWQCLGRHLSLMEIHKCIVEVFRNFDLQIMNPYEPCKTLNNMTFRQSDMWARVTERKKPVSKPVV